MIAYGIKLSIDNEFAGDVVLEVKTKSLNSIHDCKELEQIILYIVLLHHLTDLLHAPMRAFRAVRVFHI